VPPVSDGDNIRKAGDDSIKTWAPPFLNAKIKIGVVPIPNIVISASPCKCVFPEKDPSYTLRREVGKFKERG
jgi:hypothetical protein